MLAYAEEKHQRNTRKDQEAQRSNAYKTMSKSCEDLLRPMKKAPHPFPCTVYRQHWQMQAAAPVECRVLHVLNRHGF